MAWVDKKLRANSRRIVLNLAVILLFFVAAEVLVRVLPEPERAVTSPDIAAVSSFENVTVPYEYLEDACQISKDMLDANKNRFSNATNRSRQNIFNDMGGIYVMESYNVDGFNSEGFRDVEHSIEKPNNTFRILVLGASETEFGGNRIADLYPRVLEGYLNNHSKTVKYEVIMMAQVGTFFDTKLCMLKNNGLKYSPDLVLFKTGRREIIDLFFINEEVMMNYYLNKTSDFILVSTLREENMLGRARNRIKLLDYAAQLIAKKEIQTERLTNDLWRNRELMENYMNSLHEFRSICESNNLTCLALFAPGDYYSYNDPGLKLEQVAGSLDRAGIGYLNVTPDMRKYTIDRYSFVNDKHHPNPFGHRVIAASLYNNLVSNYLVPNWQELELIDVSAMELEGDEYYMSPLENGLYQVKDQPFIVRVSSPNPQGSVTPGATNI